MARVLMEILVGLLNDAFAGLDVGGGRVGRGVFVLIGVFKHFEFVNGFAEIVLVETDFADGDCGAEGLC